jgi:splicing factor 3A subunit 3
MRVCSSWAGAQLYDKTHSSALHSTSHGAGADKVRAALAARNMKVGGTPLQRAQRLFLCAGKALHDLPPSVFAAGAAPASALAEATRSKRLSVAKQVANVECKVLAVVASLGPVIDDTYHWVEKKLAQNYEEVKQDIEREDFDIGGDDSDEEVRLFGR